jgi:hypothetical protein
MKRQRDEHPTSQPSHPKHPKPGASSVPSSRAAVRPASASITPSTLPVHAFTVSDPRDHAETPLAAYEHLEPLLFKLCGALGKSKASLVIYDPFYCAGSMAQHLHSLGFLTVINRNEDCYAAWAEGRTPEYDVLVTNPPFSGDHIPKTLAFAASSGKPWAILIPEFCARKAYYKPALGIAVGGSGSSSSSSAGGSAGSAGSAAPPATPLLSTKCGPIHYLGPKSAAYMFSAPNRGISGAPLLAASAASAPAPRVSHLFAATFQCVWFLALGAAHSGPILTWWQRKVAPSASCCIASSELALPQLALDPGKKRREEEVDKRKWRKKLSRQRKQAAAAAGSAGGQ